MFFKYFFPACVLSLHLLNSAFQKAIIFNLMKFNRSTFRLWFYALVMNQSLFLYIWMPSSCLIIERLSSFPELPWHIVKSQGAGRRGSVCLLTYVSVTTPTYTVCITPPLEKALRSGGSLIRNYFGTSKSFIFNINFNTNWLLRFRLYWIYKSVLGELTILHYWGF